MEDHHQVSCKMVQRAFEELGWVAVQAPYKPKGYIGKARTDDLAAKIIFTGLPPGHKDNPNVRGEWGLEEASRRNDFQHMVRLVAPFEDGRKKEWLTPYSIFDTKSNPPFDLGLCWKCHRPQGACRPECEYKRKKEKEA